MFEERLFDLVSVLQRVTEPLVKESIPHELIDGLAVLVHVEEADPTHATLTRDVDLMIYRADLERVKQAADLKAEAYHEWNQAGVVDKLITNMPDVVRALAEPLAKVDRITIVSTGNGNEAGAHKITGDITKMAAQIPALFETLSGMPLSELLSNVRPIGSANGK